MADNGEKVARKQRGRYREYMRHSNPYKFPAARRRKGNLYKAKQSSTGTRNDLNKCDVEEMIPDTRHAQPLCTGDPAEIFEAEVSTEQPTTSVLIALNSLILSLKAMISVGQTKVLQMTTNRCYL